MEFLTSASLLSMIWRIMVMGMVNLMVNVMVVVMVVVMVTVLMMRLQCLSVLVCNDNDDIGLCTQSYHKVNDADDDGDDIGDGV